AHHVATVREVDGQHRSAAVLYRGRPVVMELPIVVSPHVATGEIRLDPLEETGVDRHQILETPVLRALLDHPDLTVALDDLGLDLAHLLVDEDVIILLALDDPLPRLHDALGTKGVGLTRPPESRLGLFPRLEKRVVALFWCVRA